MSKYAFMILAITMLTCQRSYAVIELAFNRLTVFPDVLDYEPARWKAYGPEGEELFTGGFRVVETSAFERVATVHVTDRLHHIDVVLPKSASREPFRLSFLCLGFFQRPSFYPDEEMRCRILGPCDGERYVVNCWELRPSGDEGAGQARHLKDE